MLLTFLASVVIISFPYDEIKYLLDVPLFLISYSEDSIDS